VAERQRVTLGADKAYDSRDFVAALRLLQVTPHVAQNTSNRSSAIDRRTTRHAGYDVSQAKRKRIEEIFGWLKTIGLLRQTRHRGRRRVGWMFVFSLAVYNLVRIRNLTEQWHDSPGPAGRCNGPERRPPSTACLRAFVPAISFVADEYVSFTRFFRSLLD
jgi:hypothetical protein